MGDVPEQIQSVPSWRGKQARCDCVLVAEDTKTGMKGLSVVWVQLFSPFHSQRDSVPCALVEWFKKVGQGPDPQIGLWRVRINVVQGQSEISVLHVDSLLRRAHFLPIFSGNSFLPHGFNFEDTLDAFPTYYVNKVIDHHAHKILFLISFIHFYL
ncbi:hypothetical protein BDN72DRAFT_768205 [Pluteus cervinus]|uniref:Uncharacterized protein n=1 Tax=Pluteus cervinus TaxID=181527 RepID=A0ACD3AU18_9AGAR|nr:hypothetical protein BDN72DRAFT_768205 [Pluteus cervinus]